MQIIILRLALTSRLDDIVCFGSPREYATLMKSIVAVRTGGAGCAWAAPEIL
jgi:hypothetical protein